MSGCRVLQAYLVSTKIFSHFSCAFYPHTPPRRIFSVSDKCCSNIMSWWKYAISSDRLLTFIIGTCDAIQKISQIRPISTLQYRPMLRTKGSNILSRSRTTANIYQISRTVTWRRISHTAWLSSGVLQKLWGLRRPILIRCCYGLRRKWAKSIWWTQRYKAKMSRSPERHRGMDSQPLNPSCRVWRTCCVCIWPFWPNVYFLHLIGRVIVCYTAVFSVVGQRSFPQTVAENRTTFLSCS